MALWSLFRELHAGSTTWGVQARIVRLYKQPNARNCTQVGSVEMIRHDAEGDRIHASMTPDLYQRFQKLLVEGRTCRITHLLIKENTWKCKTTTNPQWIKLYCKSVVLPFEDKNFPSFMVQLHEFSDLTLPIPDEPYNLVDVIGRVISYQEPAKVHALGIRRLDFKIEDTRGNVLACCLWADYVDTVLPALEHNSNIPCIVLFRFGKVGEFRGEMKLQNTYHVTQVIVNGEDDVFRQFRSRMELQGGGSISKVMFSEYEQQVHDDFSQGKALVKSLGYLNGLKEVKNVWVDVLILDIDTSRDIWYLACKKCVKKVYIEGGRKMCWTCREEVFTDTYRYKIPITVWDKTGSSTLMMWNREAAALIGMSAGEVREMDATSDKGLKFVKKALLDKKFIFEVKKQETRNNTSLDFFNITRAVLNDETKELYKMKCTTDDDSTNDVPADMQGKGAELIEVSSKSDDPKGKGLLIKDAEDDPKGKGLLIEDIEDDFSEKGIEHEADQQLFLDGTTTDNDADDGSESKEKLPDKVAENQLTLIGETASIPDATYALKRKRIKKEK
ncbi:hypothetical protein CASFOL_032332 [Castilleja foliolosa]|uniref:Uncharacterized protein n=1 Tax=Castilleja foliolosa TaxID=1961234 RepID=A0ABD3C2X8_9LAMI